MLTDEQRAMLAQDLPRDAVRRREQAGQSLSYVEGHYVVSRLNQVLGFDGWSFVLPRGVREVYRGEREGRQGQNVVVLFQADGRLEAAGVVREDVGVGVCDANQKALAQGIEKALKEAVTDALKRCAKSLGKSFGLALYDKSWAGVGYSTATLVMLDEVDGLGTVEGVNAWAKANAADVGKLDPDEQAVVRGRVASRRKELVAPPVTLVVQSEPAVAPQPAPTVTAPATQAQAPNTPPAPAEDSLAWLRSRVEGCHSVEEIVAVARAHGVEVPEARLGEVGEWVHARSKALGLPNEGWKARSDIAKALKLPAEAWKALAAILRDQAEASHAEALRGVLKAHASTYAKLPEPLKATVQTFHKRRMAVWKLLASIDAADCAPAFADALKALEALREELVPSEWAALSARYESALARWEASMEREPTGEAA